MRQHTISTLSVNFEKQFCHKFYVPRRQKKDCVPFDVSTGNLFLLTNRTLCAEYGYHVKYLTNISCCTLPENNKFWFYFSCNHVLEEFIFAIFI